MTNIDLLYRKLYSKMVSVLISHFGLANFAIAEDVVQETFVAAVERWSAEGEPREPEAWLFRVCRNKAINQLRKKSTKVAEESNESGLAIDADTLPDLFLDHEIADQQLRLLFACCDERLSPKSQVMLILRNLCGLKTQEIGRALMMNEESVTRSLTRSKEVLATAGLPEIPSIHASAGRLKTVHTAIYLLFTEGYSPTSGEEAIRRELCVEAMRLIRGILDIPLLRNFDTYAIMALMCFHCARFEARVDKEGELVELEEQDRSKWDRELIRLGIHYLKSAHDSNMTSRFVFEAAIASVHAVAESFDRTNWAAIVGLYDRLVEVAPSPFTDLNRAAAIYYAESARMSLKALEASRHQTWLRNHYLYHALMGKIMASLGQGIDAIRHYEKALSLCRLRAEKQFLQNKIATLQTAMN